MDEYERRVRQLEAEGLTRSDAQSVVEAEDARARRQVLATIGGIP